MTIFGAADSEYRFGRGEVLNMVVDYMSVRNHVMLNSEHPQLSFCKISCVPHSHEPNVLSPSIPLSLILLQIMLLVKFVLIPGYTTTALFGRVPKRYDIPLSTMYR